MGEMQMSKGQPLHFHLEDDPTVIALRAQVAAQRDILTSLVKVVGHMKVPQTIADAALQLLIVGPVLKRAQDFLEKEAQP